MSLLCYMFELDVIIVEEELFKTASDLYHLREKLRSQGSSVSPACIFFASHIRCETIKGIRGNLCLTCFVLKTSALRS